MDKPCEHKHMLMYDDDLGECLDCGYVYVNLFDDLPGNSNFADKFEQAVIDRLQKISDAEPGRESEGQE